ncbi:hypothetical protein [Brevibacillus brevis]|uniref:hypothetical protein n=1 Tax=Brevibacillus brevis TaxID=1393 RepID=UPI000D106855|nr:hypothetical protein [Brevibacillus brevis]PSJ70969.1 hypothetical protein C7J99_01860 [Brevibacillus brevis]RED24328.1 hypothetical protein DES34_11374 [Brevibacillus brevis]GEC91976.1 hypothetical protein BBR01nite_43070 [Brevibacillus brevis]VEF91841.1 Uncharacterised protein [Brevibacillus brevis]
MKKILIMLSLILVLTSGCNKDAADINEDEIRMLAYTYSENVFNNYRYVGSISDFLGNANGKEITLESLQMYVSGYKQGNSRMKIYESVENIISLYFAKHYNEQIIAKLFDANRKLTQLTRQLNDLLTEEHIAAELSANQIIELRERIDDLLIYVYPEQDETDINLYTLITKPEKLLEKYTVTDIDIFFMNFNNAMEQLNNFIEQVTKT